MKIKDVVFDFDGTLVDSAPCILRCYELVLQQLDIQPKITINEDIIGPPLTDTLITLTGIDDQKEINVMAELFKSFYDEQVATETLPYPNILSVLEGLKSLNINLYIATNKRAIPTMKVIEHLGWNDYFISIRSIDQLAPERRNKSSLIKDMLEQHNLSVDTAVYIGDKQDDFIAANVNNLPFLAAAWGYGDWNNDEENTISLPSYLLSHLINNG